ncbi:integrase [Bradyrhizobium canariense]|uniref:integrase n=1 Tax=Bradyrhizobium TaxID=374 RepID=UPI0005693B5D|nr:MULTISPECIES: integrase [Bradyrhizobium]MBW5437530.1 integrase [Bradyrhizobium canariense]
MLTDTGLPKLKPGKKLYKRGDRDGMYVTVLPINRRKQICESGDHSIKVVH